MNRNKRDESLKYDSKKIHTQNACRRIHDKQMDKNMRTNRIKIFQLYKYYIIHIH